MKEDWASMAEASGIVGSLDEASGFNEAGAFGDDFSIDKAAFDDGNPSDDIGSLDSKEVLDDE